MAQAKTIIEKHLLYEQHKEPVELLYYPTSHKYKVNGEEVLGVSGIKSIIAQPGLEFYKMNEALSHARRGLLTAFSNEVVSHTTLSLESLLEASKMAHKAKTDRGADIGTKIHEFIEQYFIAHRDGTPYPELPLHLPEPKKARECKTYEELDERNLVIEHNNMVDALREFVTWVSRHNVRVKHLERIVWSKKYQYAGRFDAILEINGDLYLVDFKTNNPSAHYPDGIYPDFFCQLGLYDVAITEELWPHLHEKNESPFKGHLVFNFSKRTGRFLTNINKVNPDDVRVNRAWAQSTIGTKRGEQYWVRKMSKQYKENR